MHHVRFLTSARAKKTPHLTKLGRCLLKSRSIIEIKLDRMITCFLLPIQLGQQRAENNPTRYRTKQQF